jgi:HAD superfamily hydrolase (TIGR01509 family)
LISAEAKYSKPDKRIYEILTERYSLVPEECLFIDDLEINVISAQAVGMRGLFTNGSLRIEKEVEKFLSVEM